MALISLPTVDPKQAAQLLGNGLPVSMAAQRSQYLADALKNLQASSDSIQSPVELAAKLGADAILSHKQGGADKALIEALMQQRQQENEGALAGLDAGLGGAPASPPPSAPPAPALGQPAAPASAPAPQDLAGALYQAVRTQESGNRPGVTGPPTPYGRAQGASQMLPQTAQAMAEKLGIPWRPQLMTGTTPEAANYQDQLGRAYLAEGLQRGNGDPRQAAMYYFGGPNTKLWGPKTHAYADQVLARLGPANAPGGPQLGAGADAGSVPGVGLGAGQPVVGAQQAQAPQLPLDQAQSFQVASNGPTPMPVQPSSPGPGPLAAGGAPPAAVSPAAGGPGDVTPQEVALARRLINNPSTRSQGLAYAMELQKKAVSPPTYEVGTNNGLPYWADKQHPGQITYGQIPDQIRTHPASGGEMAGLTPGTAVDVNPLGARNVLQSPPQGYQGPGGSAGPVARGPADPQAPVNRLEGLKGLRTEIAPTLTLATSLRRNYSAVQSGYQQQNGSGDIAMVNGLQKLIDDGVVREGDVSLQLQAQGIKGGIAGALAYINSSGKFSPEIRKGILNTADSLYGSINQTYRDRVMGYRDIADQNYGQGSFAQVVPADTVKALGWDGSSQSAPAGGGQPPGGAANGFTPAQHETAKRIVAQRGKTVGAPGSQTNPFAPRSAADYAAYPKGAWFIDDDGLLVQKGGR